MILYVSVSLTLAHHKAHRNAHRLPQFLASDLVFQTPSR